MGEWFPIADLKVIGADGSKQRQIAAVPSSRSSATNHLLLCRRLFPATQLRGEPPAGRSNPRFGR